MSKFPFTIENEQDLEGFLSYVRAFFLSKKTGVITGPRGLRNNNPGNLKISSIPWTGKVPRNRNTDGVFEQFEDTSGLPGMVWGVRALIKDIRTDMTRDGQDTIRSLIMEFSATDQIPYINHVSKATGFGPDQKLTANKATIQKIVQAIGDFENGVKKAITNATFNQAWAAS